MSGPFGASASTTKEKSISDKASTPLRVSRKGLVRIPGGVPSAVVGADRISVAANDEQTLTLTVVLKRDDQHGFDDFLRGLQDPQSPTYRHYLTPREQADRFGPTKKAHDEVSGWLRREGFRMVEGSANRLTLTVRGPRRRAEAAFGVEISDYRLGDRGFYANDRDPVVPAKLAPNIQALIGLSNLTKPSSSVQEANIKNFCLTVAAERVLNDPEIRACYEGRGGFVGDLYPCEERRRALYLEILQRCYDTGPGGAGNGPGGMPEPSLSLSPLQTLALPSGTSLPWSGIDGTGQTVGLLEFDTFKVNDIRDYLAFTGRPAASISRLSQVHVNGGAALGPEESEVLIDIVAVMTTARGANVVVYDAPFAGIKTSFQTLFNRMISDGVTVISNSWVYCEDQATLADAQSIDAVLASAAAAGITVLNSSGDFGSMCMNGSGNTISIPADSPHASAVGGTSLNPGPASTYDSELFWNGSTQTPPTGSGGFGVSRFFNRPSYQQGFADGPMRSIPDVSLNADPTKGISICQADAGGCPASSSFGGTSLSAPLWASFVALLNQAQGQNLGELNPLLYSIANNNTFHSAASMGSDFAHVGLGSPNLNLIHRALTGKTAGPVSASVSEVTADPAGATADGNAEAFIVVRLRDADGHTVSGKSVTLTGNSGSHATVASASGVSNVANGAVIFSIKDATPEFVTFRATDMTDNVVLQTQVEVVFITPPAAAGGVTATPTTVNANGSDSTMITVTLQDAKGNPSPNKVVNLSQGNGSSTITATTAFTDATGKIQFTAINSIAQTVTYTAVDITDGNLPVPGSAVVNFVNASGFCAGTNSYRVGTAAPGYAVSTFASSFPLDCFTGTGPIGLAFSQNGTLFVSDEQNNNLYAFGQPGGTAGPATLVGTVTPSFGGSLAGLAFTKDGRFYAMLSNLNNLVEIDPANGAVIRQVVHLNGGSRFALAVDPLSGDLFVSGFDGIERISNFASGPGTDTHYLSGDFDGIAFAPDGTLYAAAELQDAIYRIAGTVAPTPGTATAITFLPGNPDGIALEANPANPAKPFLYVNRNDGTITRIDTSALPDTPQGACTTGCSDIYTGGSRGDFVTVGPSGCLFATQSERVIRLTKADGSCSLLPADIVPRLALTPETVSPSPAQGTTVTFTAQLKNVANPEGVPVTLFVSGANPIARLVRADKNGNAVLTYTGVGVGDDKTFASADLSGTTIFSNESKVTWTPGKHGTFLTLNLSPSSGTVSKPLTLVGTLVDVSATPNPMAVAGASVNFTLAGQTCTGTTDTTGTVSCSLTPAVAVGSYPMNATFAGNTTLLSSSASKNVDLLEAAPNPTVVQFSSANYSVVEACTTVTVTVNRTGDLSGISSVDYFSSDGTASELRDYVTAVGTITFAPGETSKSLALLINDDSYVNGARTFTVNLKNSTFATIASPATATVTIVDNDTQTNTTNVIDNTQDFVCQHYHDFLNRQPDAPGLAFWTGQITSCGSDQGCIEAARVNVSASFFLSIEFQETGYLVERLYKTAYGDTNGTSTLGGSHQLSVPVVRYSDFLLDTQKIGQGVVVLQPGWETVLENNKQAFTMEFVQRSRFTSAFPTSMAPAQFVDALFANTRVTPSAADRNRAISEFGSVSTTFDVAARARALRDVAENPTFSGQELNRVFVLAQYFDYLRRNPNSSPDADFTGYDFWLTKLNQFNGNFINAEMVKAFLTSIEYRARFGAN